MTPNLYGTESFFFLLFVRISGFFLWYQTWLTLAADSLTLCMLRVLHSLIVTARNFVAVYLFCIGCNKSWFALILQQRQRLCRHHFRSVSIWNAAHFVCFFFLSCFGFQFDTVCSEFSICTMFAQFWRRLAESTSTSSALFFFFFFVCVFADVSLLVSWMDH